jgi:hypothetical protein
LKTKRILAKYIKTNQQFPVDLLSQNAGKLLNEREKRAEKAKSRAIRSEVKILQ